MTSPNTKDSKLNRLMKRQRATDAKVESIRLCMLASLVRQRELLAENIKLRQANAFLAKPLQRTAPLRDVPTLHVADIATADHIHPNAVPHDFSDGRWSRCKRCRKLKLALEGSGEGCTST